MRLRFAVLLVVFAASLSPPAAGAVPCPPLECGPAIAAAADGRILAVTSGDGHSTALYDASSGKMRAVIPYGIVSADGTRAVGQSGQSLQTYEPARARVVSRASLPLGWTLAGLSADGRRIVTVRHDGAKTEFIVRGTEPGGVKLDGQFAFDGILGSRLYVIEQRKSGYLVRVADLASGLLDAEPLKDADEPALIQGIAWSRLASPDGRYVFTLYLEGEGDAMIHVLDMQAGTAKCIDLPGDTSFESAASYALALSRDGRTLYAASGANGTVATVDVASQHVVKVARVAKATTTVVNGRILPSATLSRDGKRLAFAVNHTLWVYDLAGGKLIRKQTIPMGAVGYSRAGVLWVVGEDGLARRAKV